LFLGEQLNGAYRERWLEFWWDRASIQNEIHRNKQHKISKTIKKQLFGDWRSGHPYECQHNLQYEVKKSQDLSYCYMPLQWHTCNAALIKANDFLNDFLRPWYTPPQGWASPKTSFIVELRAACDCAAACRSLSLLFFSLPIAAAYRNFSSNYKACEGSMATLRSRAAARSRRRSGFDSRHEEVELVLGRFAHFSRIAVAWHSSSQEDSPTDPYWKWNGSAENSRDTAHLESIYSGS
jgi:hypothetical protein